MTLINRATQKDVHQMKKAKYIEYIMELPGFNYEDELGFEDFPRMVLSDKSKSAIQLKYFDNNGKGIKPEKAHKINAGYDLKYPGKDTLVFQPKSLNKINLRIALKIPPGAIIQIASRSSLASKEINVRGGIIDTGYTGDIIIMLQNKTDKSFRIEHAEKIAQAIYQPLINILGLQSVNNREQLGKSE
ncbi:hypothetical protein G9A89_008169 [Geosiphon pyriformis]|nr:hypothetical protein G9A89_008169 [Geosiphon pyriformis]